MDDRENMRPTPLAKGKSVVARQLTDEPEIRSIIAHSGFSFNEQPPSSEWFCRDGRWKGIFSGRSQLAISGTWDVRDGCLFVSADIPPWIGERYRNSERALYLDRDGKLYVRQFFERFSESLPEIANHHALRLPPDPFGRDVSESEMLDRMFAAAPKLGRRLLLPE